MKGYNILIIDDEAAQRETLKGFLQKKGFGVFDAGNGTDGIKVFSEKSIDLVLTDFKMPDMSGAEVLNEIIRINPITPVIVMTAYGSIEDAVGLMKSGAYDYIQKPVDLMELLMVIEKANERSMLISENEFLKKQLIERYSFASIVTNSPEMDSALNTAARVAASKAGVLIRGESGTGKELVARAIHLAGDRSDKPFIVINCAAMPETLFESELFGHEKGAFTGASSSRKGKFEEADGGTLFIDEAGDIPPAIQVKLLRAIQFGEVQRLGSNKSINTDVRIIAATNRNLEEMIARNEFREDLFYRLNVVTIEIPPLRTRKGDIPYLIDHFIRKYSESNNKQVEGVSREAAEVLLKYRYPGNVRELENIIQRAVVLTRDKIISKKDLPECVFEIARQDCSARGALSEIDDLNQAVEMLERGMIEKALRQTGGNQTKAAEILNISERTLRYKLSKLHEKE